MCPLYVAGLIGPGDRKSVQPMAERLPGGPGAWLVVDDTALPKKGDRTVCVAPQYASARGKNATSDVRRRCRRA